jgi:deoxycytidylate deaminase
MSLKIIHSLINSITEPNSSQYHHHYSGIYRNGKKLYLGSNHLRNSYNNKCTCYSTHAEMDVIYKALRNNFNDLSTCTIAVIRFGRDGTLKNSRPCNHCLESMKFYRIKKIMYSTDDGTIKSEKPETMEQLHISSGWSAFSNPERLKLKFKEMS